MNIKNDEHYLERTPGLIAQIRAMREEMQKQMDRFTRVEDYDVRRVVGHGPAPERASAKIAAPSPASKSAQPSAVPEQTSIEFGESA